MLDNLEKFVSPSDKYTAVPFWFWNDDLKEEEIIRQIKDFKYKGIMDLLFIPVGMTPT